MATPPDPPSSSPQGHSFKDSQADTSNKQTGNWQSQSVQTSVVGTPLPPEPSDTSDKSILSRSPSTSSSGSYATPPESPVHQKQGEVELKAAPFLAEDEQAGYMKMMTLISRHPEYFDQKKLAQCLNLGLEPEPSIPTANESEKKTSKKKKAAAVKIDDLIAIRHPVVPRNTPELITWLRQDSRHAFPALCFGLAASQHSSEDIKAWGRSCIGLACIHQPARALGFINGWLALAELQKPNLSKLDQANIITALESASLFGAPIADWVLAMASFGLVPNLPPMDPRNSVTRLMSCAGRMNPLVCMQIPEQMRPTVLPMMDPLSFSPLEKVIKEFEERPEKSFSELAESIQDIHDPRFQYEFLPHTLKLLFSVNTPIQNPNSSSTLIDDLDPGCPAVRAVKPLKMVLGPIREVEKQIAILQNSYSGPVVQLQALQAAFPPESPTYHQIDQQIEQLEEQLAQEKKHFKVQFSKGLSESSRKAEKILRQALSQSNLPKHYEALLHVSLGILHELGLLEDESPKLSAANHYFEAARIGGFTNLLHYSSRVFANNNLFEKAAQSMEILASNVLVPSYSRFCLEQAASYRSQKLPPDMPERLPTLEEADRLLETLTQEKPEPARRDKKSFEKPDNQWLPASLTQEQSTRKKQSRPNTAPSKKTVGKQKKPPRIKSAPPQHRPTPEPLADNPPAPLPDLIADLVEKEPIPTPPTPAPEPPEFLPETEQEDWIQVARTTRQKSPDKLLPRRWPEEIYEVVGAAIKFRDKGLLAKERQILEKALKKFSGQPGVERLHEEFAWHLIKTQNEPIFLFAENSTSLLNVGEYFKPMAKSALDEAEKHLRIALARKLLIKTSELPEDIFHDCDAMADEIEKRFSRKKDKQQYRAGYTYIVSSLGHLYDHRAGVSSTGGAATSDQKSHQAYGMKRV